MAVRKPLVLDANNEIAELDAADTLDATVSEVDILSLSNANSAAITIGQAVYTASAGSVDLARANAAGTTKVLGFVKAASIAASAIGPIQTDGVLHATTAQWDAVTGGSGGLTAGTEYLLSPSTAGRIVPRTTTTVGAGEYVCPVGTAISTTELEISIKERVKRS